MSWRGSPDAVLGWLWTRSLGARVVSLEACGTRPSKFARIEYDGCGRARCAVDVGNLEQNFDCNVMGGKKGP